MQCYHGGGGITKCIGQVRLLLFFSISIQLEDIFECLLLVVAHTVS